VSAAEPGIDRQRIEVPPDSRDVDGTFRYQRTIEVRFADTDAMGHVNNANYLTYLELARAGYHETVTGRPLPLGVHGAEEGMILADVRIAFRTTVLFGEILTIEARVDRIGRSSFTMTFRLTAPSSRYGEARLVAVGEAVQVTYDYSVERPIPVPPDLAAAMEAYEGRSLR
jgi:acyl-CoA thioester hydrolase